MSDLTEHVAVETFTEHEGVIEPDGCVCRADGREYPCSRAYLRELAESSGLDAREDRGGITISGGKVGEQFETIQKMHTLAVSLAHLGATCKIDTAGEFALLYVHYLP